MASEKTHITLTCTQCNNELGYKYQGHMSKFLKHQLSVVGKYKGKIDGTITMPGTLPLRSNLAYQDGTMQIIGVPKANNPLVTESHMSVLNKIASSKTTDWEFNVEFQYGYKSHEAALAFLHSAYLVAYITSKGKYAFSKAGYALRKVLNNSNSVDIKDCVIIPESIGYPSDIWIAEVVEPENLKCVLVKVAGNVVILPAFPNDSLSCYEEWRNVSKQHHFGLVVQSNFKFRFDSKADYKEAQKTFPTKLKL